MSRLIGGAGERWSLKRAVDALADSARRAGRPGWIWVAGIFYPSFLLTNEVLSLFAWLLGAATYLPVPRLETQGGLTGLFTIGSPDAVVRAVALFPLMLLASRLVAGLAAVSGPEEWTAACGLPTARKSPRLATVWHRGRGITLSTFGLWVAVQLITLAAVLVFLAFVVLPVNVLGLRELSPPLVVVLSPLALFLFAYATVLQVVHQLALHSLSSNRRGVVSALTHAWRLVRSSPWAVVRGAAVDLVLSLTVFVLAKVVGMAACLTCLLYPLTVSLLRLAIAGFTGVTRAGYWAQMYRELGGLTPADRVPGLGREEARPQEG